MAERDSDYGQPDVPPPPATGGPVWTDPDNAPPDWLHDPNAPPSSRPAPPDGLVWKFENGMWGLIQAVGANTTTPGASGGGNLAAIEAAGRAADAAAGRVGGYMNGNVWVNGSPTSTGGGGGGGGGNGQFNYGRGDLPGFSPYREMAPFQFSQGPFSYSAFTPTDREGLYDNNQNPGFVKSQERLRKMIEAGAAFKGVLRSGNTFDELGSVLGNNEEQQFKGFDDRRFRDWSGNRANAADAWSRNLGAEQFSYSGAATENERFNNYRFNTENSDRNDVLSRWQSLISQLGSVAKP